MDAHLDDCPACRKVFSSMAVTEHTVGGTLLPSAESTADPGRPEEPLHPPEALSDRYRIGEPLGQGGTGRVYAAEHLGTGRRCAVKFLSDAAAADPEAVERFSREARILGELEHRGIVSILDFDETEDGRPYLVMDCLEGEDLANRLARRGALDWQTVRRVFRQLCQALREAHAHGVLHRDLKPSNVFLVPDDFGRDRPVLLDFGLAKHNASEEPQLTRTGAILGTPAYMSPEQAKGRAVDERADVYSLAAVLYQMLTGEPPFRGSTFTEVLAQVLTDPPPPLTRRTRESTPSNLDAVIQTAMAKDPEHRYASVLDLEYAVFSEGSEPATVGNAPSRKAPERTGAVWWLVGGAAAALVLGLGVYWLQSRPRPEPRPHAITANTTANTTAGPGPDATNPAGPKQRPPPTMTVAGQLRLRPRPHPRARPRPRPRLRPRPRPRPRPRAAIAQMRASPKGQGDPIVATTNLNGKLMLKHLSQLPPARRALIRITVYMSRKDWKTCARIARKAPQVQQVVYYSIHCHYMLGDTVRTRKLCTQWRKRFPKRWKDITACLNLGHEFRTPP